MSKPPKFDLKQLINTDVASRVADAAEPPAAPSAPIAVVPAPTSEPEFAEQASAVVSLPAKKKAVPAKETLKQRAKQQSLYLEPEVYERLREIAFMERKPMHDLFLEGIDAVLKKRGAPSIKQLVKKAG